MDRTEKKTIVDGLRQELSLEGGALVVVAYQGLTVAMADDVRKRFREADCRYRVVKNTLLKRAVEGTPLESVSTLCVGSTAIAYSKDDPVAPARAAVDCQKEHKPFEVKGGFFEEFLDAANVEHLARMPSKDEMRGRFLATLLAVPQSFLRLLQAAPHRMLLVLEARKRSLESE